MYASVNGIVLLEGQIVLPRAGVWRAEVTIDADAPPADPITISLGTGATAVVFKGQAYRKGPYAGMSYLKVQGGAGGLGKQVAALQFTSCPATLPITATLAEVGEVAGSITAPGDIDFWSRATGTAGAALQALADDVGGGTVWRVNPDGTVFFGVDAFPDAPATSDPPLVTNQGPSNGWFQIAGEQPTLTPGTNFNGQHVSRVRHIITAGSLRTEFWAEELSS